jgi:hypothetical protein
MSHTTEPATSAEICPCCGRPLGPLRPGDYPEEAKMDEALAFIMTALNIRKTLPLRKVMETCERRSIPLDSMIEAARLLKLDRVVDDFTGEEIWQTSK